jgi:predicted enzyme related to lactoylglutathione lyase
MGISLDGLKYHVANAVAKLSLTSRRDLTQWHGAPRDSATGASTMSGGPALGPVGQISRQVTDIDAAITWYRDVLGLPHLYTFGTLAFFDCHGIRLYLSAGKKEGAEDGESVLYFRTDNIEDSFEQLTARGIKFRGAPHMIYRHADGLEEWMAFFDDPEGRPLALMSQVRRSG